MRKLLLQARHSPKHLERNIYKTTYQKIRQNTNVQCFTQQSILLNLQHVPQVCKSVCMTFIFQNVYKTTETYKLYS